jgi:hypothetical protein
MKSQCKSSNSKGVFVLKNRLELLIRLGLRFGMTISINKHLTFKVKNSHKHKFLLQIQKVLMDIV